MYYFAKFQVLFFTLGLFLTACVSNKMPDEITREFWQAVSQQDEMQAMQYVSQEGGAIQLDLSHSRWSGLQITLGEILINNNKAEVDTYLLFKGHADTVEGKTYLIREVDSGQWLIDYPATIAAIPVDQNQGVLKKWQSMGERFSREIDQAFGEFQQEIPRMEQSLEQFGHSLKQDLEQAWRRKIPEIKQQVDSFVDELDQALEEAEKEIEKQRKEIEKQEEDQQQEPNGNYI